MYTLAACMVVGSLIGLLILQSVQLLGECGFTDEELDKIKQSIISIFSGKRERNGKNRKNNG